MNQQVDCSAVGITVNKNFSVDSFPIIFDATSIDTAFLMFWIFMNFMNFVGMNGTDLISDRKVLQFNIRYSILAENNMNQKFQVSTVNFCEASSAD